MAIVYQCRHCNAKIAELNENNVDITQLGWTDLNAAEYQEMVQYDNGNIRCKVVCEDCEHTLKQNPAYHELDYFIQ